MFFPILTIPELSSTNLATVPPVVTTSKGCDGDAVPIPTVLAEDDYAMTDPSTEVKVIIDTNDIGDVTTIQIVNGPENGVATVDLMGNLTYTPNDGYSGIDSLVYTICDEFCSLE